MSSIGIGRMVCEGHLGGFIEGGDPKTYCPNVWDYFILEERVSSMVDVGCGIGVACEYFHRRGVPVTGIDGSETAGRMFVGPIGAFVLHDFANDSVYSPEFQLDLAWSCEFVEHVEPRYVENFMYTLRFCRTVAMTYAAPGQAGHHHVNCQPADYWIGAFAAIGLALDEPTTTRLRELDPGTHFAERGMVFRRCN